MASSLSRAASNLLRVTPNNPLSKASASTGTPIFNLSRSKKMWAAAAGAVTLSGLGVAIALNESVKAADLMLHPPNYAWGHSGNPLKSIDMASARRGYQVYKQVCSACHSLKYVAYRELVNVMLTEDEAKQEASEIQVQDGPDDEGNMFMRPGKLADYMPSPYPNEEAARAANNGAYPPDLTYITLARHGGEDYVFSILTGYTDAPAGVTVQDGSHFNVYFPGGAIGMGQPLYNDTITYEDGTPTSQAQLAKDVCTFLKWCAEPEHDERKKLAIKLTIILGVVGIAVAFWKRHTWTSIKSRKIIFRDETKKQ